jgi:hypothetical protein
MNLEEPRSLLIAALGSLLDQQTKEFRAIHSCLSSWAGTGAVVGMHRQGYDIQ